MLADLHCHSLHSDGLLSPAALARLGAARGVELMALTDHDCVDGLAEFAASCAQLGVAAVAGVELSCSWRGQTLHVLAFDIDPLARALREHLAGLVARRRRRLQLIAARLTRRCGAGHGALANSIAEDVAVPTRMHLARALVAAGHCANTGAAFRDLLVRGRPGYAPSDWPDLEQTLAVVRDAGGCAALAHPQRYRLSSGGLRALCDAFAAAGGAALEIASGPTSPNDVARLASLAHERGLLATAGSDFHDPANAWNTPGRFAKLPASAALLSARLRATNALP